MKWFKNPKGESNSRLWGFIHTFYLKKIKKYFFDKLNWNNDWVSCKIDSIIFFDVEWFLFFDSKLIFKIDIFKNKNSVKNRPFFIQKK